jgi:hypothetical protein
VARDSNSGVDGSGVLLNGENCHASTVEDDSVLATEAYGEAASTALEEVCGPYPQDNTAPSDFDRVGTVAALVLDDQKSEMADFVATDRSDSCLWPRRTGWIDTTLGYENPLTQDSCYSSVAARS